MLLVSSILVFHHYRVLVGCLLWYIMRSSGIISCQSLTADLYYPYVINCTARSTTHQTYIISIIRTLSKFHIYQKLLK